MRKDFVNYLIDILFMRTDALIFKTAGFCKRNWLRTLNVLSNVEYYLRHAGHALWHGVLHMIHGLKSLVRDGRWLVEAKHSEFHTKYGEVSYT